VSRLPTILCFVWWVDKIFGFMASVDDGANGFDGGDYRSELGAQRIRVEAKECEALEMAKKISKIAYCLTLYTTSVHIRTSFESPYCKHGTECDLNRK